MKRQHLIKLLHHLLPCILPGYTIQKNYTLPDLAATVDFLASVGEENFSLKKIFIQASDLIQPETIQTHAILKHELAEKGIFKGKDEYWLVVPGAAKELETMAKGKCIRLLDGEWLQKEVSENFDDSRQLREIVKSLESIGSGLGS